MRRACYAKYGVTDLKDDLLVWFVGNVSKPSSTSKSTNEHRRIGFYMFYSGRCVGRHVEA